MEMAVVVGRWNTILQLVSKVIGCAARKIFSIHKILVMVFQYSHYQDTGTPGLLSWKGGNCYTHIIMLDTTCTLYFPSILVSESETYTIGWWWIAQKLCLWSSFKVLGLTKHKELFLLQSQLKWFLTLTRKMLEECLIWACCHGQQKIVLSWNIFM